MEDCKGKLPSYRGLVSNGKCVPMDRLDWRPGKKGDLVIFDTLTGKETCVVQFYSTFKIFTGGEDPTKFGVKVDLPDDCEEAEQISALFLERLPAAMVKHVDKLSVTKDRKKALLTNNQVKAINGKKTDKEKIEYVRDMIILDESGPHVPLKFWTDKEGVTRKQFSVTHKAITPAYEAKPLTAADIENIPSFLQDAAHANLSKGVVYKQLPIVGTAGTVLEDPLEAPNYNGTINGIGRVEVYIASIKAEQIKYTATKLTAIDVLGFAAGAEEPEPIAANSLFAD